jgi:hypothetical protein
LGGELSDVTELKDLGIRNGAPDRKKDGASNGFYVATRATNIKPASLTAFEKSGSTL